MDNIDYRKEGHVAVIILNRPEKLNALHPTMARALADQMADYMVLQWSAELMKTEDYKEALNAFLEKRAPKYQGR